MGLRQNKKNSILPPLKGILRKTSHQTGMNFTLRSYIMLERVNIALYIS